MQISSTRSGLYPAVLPATRGPGTGAPVLPNANGATADDALSLRPVVAPDAAPGVASDPNTDSSRALLLARQRDGVEVLTGVVQSGQSGNEAAARRAVAEYNTVALQGQRFESDGVLVGIDVFA